MVSNKPLISLKIWWKPPSIPCVEERRHNLLISLHEYSTVEQLILLVEKTFHAPCAALVQCCPQFVGIYFHCSDKLWYCSRPCACCIKKVIKSITPARAILNVERKWIVTPRPWCMVGFSLMIFWAVTEAPCNAGASSFAAVINFLYRWDRCMCNAWLFPITKFDNEFDLQVRMKETPLKMVRDSHEAVNAALS